MRINWMPFLMLAFIIVVLMLGVTSWLFTDALIPLQQTTITSTPAMPPASSDSWIIIDLPPDASQLEYGAEVYRLVCKACHGDKGQGLTDDWRAQWNPEDQNCWQSKCHSLNHPPDGFYMPISPAVVGPPLKIFETALDLYNYIHKNMPWHNPDSMTENESWSVTAYILKINGVNPGPELNAETAANIDLSVINPNLGPSPVPPFQETQLSTALENTLVPIPTLGHVNQPTGTPASLWIFALVLLIIVIVVTATLLRRPTAG